MFDLYGKIGMNKEYLKVHSRFKLLYKDAYRINYNSSFEDIRESKQKINKFYKENLDLSNTQLYYRKIFLKRNKAVRRDVSKPLVLAIAVTIYTYLIVKLHSEFSALITSEILKLENVIRDKLVSNGLTMLDVNKVADGQLSRILYHAQLKMNLFHYGYLLFVFIMAIVIYKLSYHKTETKVIIKEDLYQYEMCIIDEKLINSNKDKKNDGIQEDSIGTEDKSNSANNCVETYSKFEYSLRKFRVSMMYFMPFFSSDHYATQKRKIIVDNYYNMKKNISEDFIIKRINKLNAEINSWIKVELPILFMFLGLGITATIELREKIVIPIQLYIILVGAVTSIYFSVFISRCKNKDIIKVYELDVLIKKVEDSMILSRTYYFIDRKLFIK